MRRLGVFSRCTFAELDWARRHLTLLAFPSGRHLIEEGAAGSEFFVVASGEVDVVVCGGVIARLGAGAFVGELALLGGGPRSASVITRGPVQAYVASAGEFSALLDGLPTLTRKVLEEVSRRNTLKAG